MQVSESQVAPSQKPRTERVWVSSKFSSPSSTFSFSPSSHLAPHQRRDETEDDLSELQSEAVPDEVRKWLASTFAKQEQVTRRSEERPSFKSVANAIRTGIFIERIYRRMSSSQLMIIPPEVQKALKVRSRKRALARFPGLMFNDSLFCTFQQSNDWTFDTFSLAVSCKGSPLRFMGYELLTRHGCLHKYKVSYIQESVEQKCLFRANKIGPLITKPSSYFSANFTTGHFDLSSSNFLLFLVV